MVIEMRLSEHKVARSQCHHNLSSVILLTNAPVIQAFHPEQPLLKVLNPWLSTAFLMQSSITVQSFVCSKGNCIEKIIYIYVWKIYACQRARERNIIVWIFLRRHG